MAELPYYISARGRGLATTAPLRDGSCRGRLSLSRRPSHAACFSWVASASFGNRVISVLAGDDQQRVSQVARSVTGAAAKPRPPRSFSRASLVSGALLRSRPGRDRERCAGVVWVTDRGAHHPHALPPPPPVRPASPKASNRAAQPLFSHQPVPTETPVT